MSGIFTLDAYTRDSTGAFFINELDRLDPRLYEPLVNITWSRDIKLRTDVSISDESTSFILSSFGAAGGINPSGKNWLAPNATSIPGIDLNGARQVAPLRPWAMELSYDMVELARSQKLNRPVDVQKFQGLNLKHQMDIDEQVYIGDTTFGNFGLVNSDKVTPVSAGAKAAGGTTWAVATPDEILSDVNTLLTSCWLNSGYAIVPGKLLLPPTLYGLLVARKVSDAGNISILKYVMENSIANQVNGSPLDIQPVKWLTGRGAGSTNRAVAYTDDESRVRFPMVPIIRSNPYYQGIRWATVYYALLGEVEFVYPETLLYMDGI